MTSWRSLSRLRDLWCFINHYCHWNTKLFESISPIEKPRLDNYLNCPYAAFCFKGL
jgi:hypothetical protein